MGFADKKNFTNKILVLLNNKIFDKYKIYVFSKKKELINKYKKIKNIFFISN